MADGAPVDLAAIYQNLLAEDQLAGFEVFQRFYEIGSPAGLADTRRHFEEKESAAVSFVETHLAEVSQIAGKIDAAAVEKMVDLLAAVRSRRRAAFPSRRRGKRGKRLPRGERFPEARGNGSLHPHGQRVRADGAHQRRGMGHRARRVAEDEPPRNSKDAVFVLSVGGGSLEKNISPNIVTRPPAREEGRREDPRHRRPGRGVHREGGGRLRPHSRR